MSFAYFVFALGQELNNAIPGYVGLDVQRDPPTDGNPLASTVPGSVVIQRLETTITIVPILTLTKLAGQDLGSERFPPSGSHEMRSLPVLFKSDDRKLPRMLIQQERASVPRQE